MPLSIGAPAPDFTLKRRHAGVMSDVTLSSHRGRDSVVLLFFPGAFTGVCTEELCNTVGTLGNVSDLGAAVYGISTDSAFAQEAWAKQAGIDVPLLSDYKRDVIKAYDVEWPDLAGLGPCAGRAAYVIGRDGRVEYVELCPALTDLPDFGAIKKVLERLI
jgi:peroxiredoxin